MHKNDEKVKLCSGYATEHYQLLDIAGFKIQDEGAVSKVVKVPDIELVEMGKSLKIKMRFDRLNGQETVLIQRQLCCDFRVSLL